MDAAYYISLLSFTSRRIMYLSGLAKWLGRHNACMICIVLWSSQVSKSEFSNCQLCMDHKDASGFSVSSDQAQVQDSKHFTVTLWNEWSWTTLRPNKRVTESPQMHGANGHRRGGRVGGGVCPPWWCRRFVQVMWREGVPHISGV